MTKLRILSIFFVLALIVSACSSSNDSGAGGETAATVGDTAASANADNEADRPEAEGQHHEAADRVVQVTAHEFGFSLDTIEVHVGETVRFEVTNEGVIEHEFRLTNQDEIDAHLAMGHEAMHDEGEGEEHAEGELEAELDGEVAPRHPPTLPAGLTGFRVEASRALPPMPG
ncbi:MAG: hypothetical protein ACE5E8_06750, partial [Acidimicrobiia bacterium]